MPVPDCACDKCENARSRQSSGRRRGGRRGGAGRVTDAAIGAAAQGLSMLHGGPVVDPTDQLTDYHEYSQQETRDRALGDSNNKGRRGGQSQR